MDAGGAFSAEHRIMLRRLFGIGWACAAIAPAWARPCRAECDGGPSHTALVHARHDFDELAHDTAALPADERIAFANLAINRLVGYAPDDELGAVDVWLTPVETLARGRGDCEDIAIAKFFLLIAAGVAPAELRLLYSRRRSAVRPGQARAHVVTLACHSCGDPLVLDNLAPAALPVSQRGDLDAVFSFDREQIWAGVDGPCRGRAAERLRPWRDLLGRMALQH